jgi:AcrR family transcriptional regulator
MVKEEILTKDRILQKAFELFIRDGYENTPIQTIIDELDIAKGTFYHHFKSKDEMLAKLVDNLTKSITAKMQEMVAQTGMDAKQKMLLVWREAVAIKLERMPENVVLARQMAVKANERLVTQIREESLKRIKPIMTELIAKGIREELFRVSDPENTAQVILSLLLGNSDLSIALFLKAWDGDDSAGDRLMALTAALEQAIGRILGLEDGTFPLYQLSTLKERLFKDRNQGAKND